MKKKTNIRAGEDDKKKEKKKEEPKKKTRRVKYPYIIITKVPPGGWG